MSAVTDEDLLARQAALQDRAREVLAGLDLGALTADAGPLLVTGSFVSGLMCWPEVDVMVLVGPDFSPPDVMALLARIVARPEVTGLDYRDERGSRCVTGEVRDERYHVKDYWHRQPAYPDDVGGLDIYNAVIDDGVRTLDEFSAWLAARDPGGAG